MTLVPSISKVIGSEWLELSPVRVGGVPSDPGAPNCYVTLADADRPLLRVDVYAYGPDLFAFQDAIVWRDHLVIGFGSHVHVVALTDHSAVTVWLGEYFGGLYPTPNYLLIESGNRVLRMEPDRSILWRTDVLAVDGVVVHDADPATIRGDAEQDPPGGWEPFTVSATDGRAVVGSKPPMPAIGKSTDEEVREILERAVRSKTDRGVTYDKLLAIGASRESIDAAAHQLQLTGESAQGSQQVLRRRLRCLTLHAFAFAVVISYVFTSSTAGRWWVLVSVFSWAVALIFHARFALSREFSARAWMAEVGRRRK